MPHCSSTSTNSVAGQSDNCNGISMSATLDSFVNPPNPLSTIDSQSTKSSQPQQHDCNGTLCVSAVKAMILLLGPKAQASCRSTCTSFAIAFTQLVDEKTISVSARTQESTTIHYVGVADYKPSQQQKDPQAHNLVQLHLAHNNQLVLPFRYRPQITVVCDDPSPFGMEQTPGSNSTTAESLCMRSTDVTMEPPPPLSTPATVATTLPSPQQRQRSSIDDGEAVSSCSENAGGARDVGWDFFDDDDDDAAVSGHIKEVKVPLPSERYDDDYDDGLQYAVRSPADMRQGAQQYQQLPSGPSGLPSSQGERPRSTRAMSSLLHFIPASPCKWLTWAPASLTSPHLHNLHVVVNIEALALSVTNPSVGYTIKPSPIPRVKYLYVHILNGLCAHLVAKSVEFIGMSKVVSIGSGMLRGADIETVTYGELPRLAKVDDDWMSGCEYLRHIRFDSPLPKLKIVRHGWMKGCRSLQRVDLTPFPTVEHVGDHWLSQCSALQYANFSTMPLLVSVGHFWLEGGVSLRHVNFADLVFLVSVGKSWLAHCAELEEVIVANTQSLQFVGSGFGCESPLLLPTATPTTPM